MDTSMEVERKDPTHWSSLDVKTMKVRKLSQVFCI